MRKEREIFDLILGVARDDDRVRAVILTGSRADPEAARDIFQDYDIIYIVREVEPFTSNHAWVDYFGKRMIMQMPEAMIDPAPRNDGTFTYLMQFCDGNRIDLTLVPLAGVARLEPENAMRVLLDKDGIAASMPRPDPSLYMPKAPSAAFFADCCNEFWWLSGYVAKGLWRGELIYAQHMLEQNRREQLMKMLHWYLGMKSNFTRSSGKLGKRFRAELEPSLWALLEQTYADAQADHVWAALFASCELFRNTARQVAAKLGFAYAIDDDENMRAHLRHVQQLPKTSTEMY